MLIDVKLAVTRLADNVMFLNGWENCSSTDTTLILSWTTQLVSLHISFEKGVSSSEDVPAETAGDTSSEPQFTDERAPEDASEPSAKGLPGTKKDVPPKAVSDGKLVKGMLARLLGVKILLGLYVREKKKQRERQGESKEMDFMMQKIFSMEASEKDWTR